MRAFCAILSTCLCLCLAEDEIIDLTHTFGKRTIYWPGNPPFNFSNVFRSPFGVASVEANAFETAEHSGTHMDAPRHFCPEGKRMHELVMDRLSGPGVVIDVRKQSEDNLDFQVTEQTFRDWEEEHGTIPDGAIVLFNFGWDKFWPNRKQVFNTEDVMNPSTFHYPGLSPNGTKWLTSNRKVHAVGGDTPSPDYGQSSLFETHVILLCDNGIVILENVANLNSMPATGTKVYIGALKLENGSGTPVRLFAVPMSSASVTRCSMLLLALTLLFAERLY
ncbi:isatin hydrolase-like [Haliotis rubra]|uniref:isatin hydrolase-like n=1 Tax=Haliotis rubra TaxID=36100 RepID=UPI001EE60820|nr:isatin hydrolase-like [Haliotis rubra]XP_046542681.1 isatin hydrolase-like [Haliotis rubra]